MENQNTADKFCYIDILNILSCVAVVGLHMNAVFWEYSTQPYWKQSLLAQVVFYFAVPVFFMITGATLMDYRKRYSTVIFLKRRFIKVLIPYFIWSLMYLVLYYLTGDISFGGGV